MFKFIDYAISHARLTIATLVFLLAAGFVAYLTIPKESDPDVNIPIIYVSLALEELFPAVAVERRTPGRRDNPSRGGVTRFGPPGVVARRVRGVRAGRAGELRGPVLSGKLIDGGAKPCATALRVTGR